MVDDHKTKEVVLVAPGPEYADTNFFLGNFHGAVPNFKDKRKGSTWTLHHEEEPKGARRDNGAGGRPWVLESGGGQRSHSGTLEGGLSGTNGNYFLLVKEGARFVTMPLTQWYNFKPSINYKVMDLDEAEAFMQSRERRTYALPTRLGAAMAKVDEDDEGEGDEEGGEDGGESEEEEARTARAKGAGGGGGGSTRRPVGEGDQQEDVAGPVGPKGEDWEHKQEAADDDIDMEESGEEEGDEEGPSPQPVKRGLSPSGSEGEEASGGRRANKLGYEDAERSPSQGSDDEDDDVDLDEMAQGLPLKGRIGAVKGGKTPPPPSASAGVTKAAPAPAGSKRPADDAASPAAAKRVKQEPGVKTEPAGGSVVPAVETAPAFDREIVDWLKQTGPILISELTTKFKRQLKNNNALKKAFFDAVKRVAKLEEIPPGSGNKMVVLKGGKK